MLISGQILKGLFQGKVLPKELDIMYGEEDESGAMLLMMCLILEMEFIDKV
jgi:hypothetical protein